MQIYCVIEYKKYIAKVAITFKCRQIRYLTTRNILEYNNTITQETFTVSKVMDTKNSPSPNGL